MRGRIRRAAVAFVVGAITLLPLSAMAAPVTTGDTTVLGAEKPDRSNNGNDTTGQAPGQGDSEGPGKPASPGNAPGQSDDGDAPGNSGSTAGQSDDGDAPGSSGSTPGQSDDGDAPGNSGNAPGQSDDGDGDAPGNSGDAPGHTGAAPGLAPDRPEPSDPGPVGRPPVTPSGVVPGSNGFGSLDPGAMSKGLGAAVLMFDVDGDSVRLIVTPAEPQGAGLSGGVLSALGPVVPPGVAEVLTSPLVVFEALLEAMASSGQALVIPFLAGAIGFFLPGMRRRNILEVVTGD